MDLCFISFCNTNFLISARSVFYNHINPIQIPPLISHPFHWTHHRDDVIYLPKACDIKFVSLRILASTLYLILSPEKKEKEKAKLCYTVCECTINLFYRFRGDAKK